ncbi:MAG TPA: hypothetical protein VGD95_04195 [Micavibrio sp.]
MSSYYYCIDPVLRHAETHDHATLISVSKTPLSCHGHREDGFVLANPLHMLRLDDPMAAAQLAQLLQDVPLYHFNLQLLLDEALSVSGRNQTVKEALSFAFGSLPLPAPLAGQYEGLFEGQLRHPALQQIDIPTLARIYVDFLMRVRRYQQDFSFQHNILGAKNELFLAQFDGIFEESKGQIRSDILLAFGIRADHDPHKPFDRYIAGGQTTARSMKISEPHELLWAWLECDQYQARRAHDIHRVMGLTGLPRLPNWVRMDIYGLMEREAMKNVFAERYLKNDPTLALLARCPTLQAVLPVSARGQIDDDIHALYNQLTPSPAPYEGQGLRFHQQASIREKEAHNIG